MKAIIRHLQHGNDQRRLVEFENIPDLLQQVDISAFARISYTNHGAHVRTQTWYPIMSLEQLDSDFRFESEFQS